MKLPAYVEEIRVPFTVRAPGGPIERWVNSFLIDGPELTLVDTAVAGAEAEILARIARRGRRRTDLSTVLLTHAHPDHIGAARPIRDATPCRFALHASERRWLEDTALQARERPVPGFDRLVVGSVRVDRVLEGGELLDLGGARSIRVLHTPGHSPGSVSFLLEREGIVFSGDAVPVPGEMPIYDDPAAVVRSLEMLRDRDVQLLLSSWDEPRGGREAHQRINDTIAWMTRIADAVREASQHLACDDPMALCREVVALLGLPSQAANPLVARSLAAHAS